MAKEQKSTVNEKKINPDSKRLEDELLLANDKLARALADYQNFQKQTNARIDMMRISSISSMAISILEIIDDLELAIKNFDPSDEKEMKAIQGLKMIQEKLESVLLKQEIQIIKPKIGDPLDLEKMEVISEIKRDNTSTENKQTGMSEIAEVLSYGCAFNETILKSAKVICYS